METQTPESKIYSLIQDLDTATITNTLFIVVNRSEIDIFKENNIKIRNIKYHPTIRTRESSREFIEYYSSHNGNIYFLGTGILHNDLFVNKDATKNDATKNMYWEPDFNCLKYLAMYPSEIVLDGDYYGEKTEAEMDATNAVFLETLKNNFRNSLFVCNDNIGILGIECYLKFHDAYYKYLDTVDSIYFVTSASGYDYYRYSGLNIACSYKTIKNMGLDHKVKKIDVYVARLFQTNPELIAWYRVQKCYDEYFIRTYKQFAGNVSISPISEQIWIGSDAYLHVKFSKKWEKEKYVPWFPENEITHIMNISHEIIDPTEMPNDTIIYEHYPISELEEDREIVKNALFKAADRLHELLEENPKNQVLVHCSLGVNRSPSVVLLYYIKYKGMSFYEAYRHIAEKRRIFTNEDLFDILYEESRSLGRETISPLKLKTHHAHNFCEPTAYMFALYDTLLLEKIFGSHSYTFCT